MRKKTTAEWVESARLRHGNRFDYSLSEYAGADKAIRIRCPTHGDFEQVANNHLQGTGCPKCGDIRKGASKIIPVSEFVSRSRKVHGDRYAYLEESYSSMAEHAQIICPDHGQFSQIAGVHAQGHGCPKCGRAKVESATRLGSDNFVARASAIYGGRYDYSYVDYIRNSTNVKIICPEHGAFSKSPQNHLKGQGCPECARIDAVVGKDEFVARSITIHGDRYDYSRVIYLTADVNVEIECRTHGVFSQTPHSHLKGKGCQKCAIISRSSNTEEFVTKARNVHGDRYDYSRVEYTHCEEKVEIICPAHGTFHQTPSNHASQSTGCPRCANVGPSKPQIELTEFLSTLTEVVPEHPMGRKRIDAFLPKFNIGVEYHGLIWHSEKFAKDPWRDMLRHLEAEEQGIRLIHVFADEWAVKRSVVKQTLRSILGLNSRLGARACTVVRPEWSDVRAFLTANHLQGAGLSRNMNYGLTHAGRLVAVATFGPSRFGTGDWEILRFSSSCNVVGGFSRLLKAFRSDHPGSVFSFSDNRWFTGNVYAKNGFRGLGVTDPGYFWTDGNSRLPRYSTQKHRLKERFPDCDPDTQTEVQIMQSRGFYRIWDCGNTRWLLD